MLTLKDLTDYELTLFRGEDPKNENRLKQIGIEPKGRWSESGLHETEWLQLVKQSIHEALPFTAKEQIKKHVSKPEGWRSPFVSFTRKKDVAMQYAFGREKRREGLLITTIIFAKRSFLPFNSFGEQVISLDKPAILPDNVGRHWIHLQNVPFSMEDKIFYKKITRDDEFLLLGDLQPGELEIEKVRN